MDLRALIQRISATKGFTLKLAFILLAAVFSVLLYFGALKCRDGNLDIGIWEVDPIWQVHFSIIGLVLVFILYSLVACYRKLKGGFDVGGMVRRNPLSSVAEGHRDSDVNHLFDDINGCLRSSSSSITWNEGLFIDGASLFLLACIAPSKLYSCIDEKVRADTRSVFISAHITFSLPSNCLTGSFAIPIILPSRGHYPDSLALENANECSVSVMNLEQSFSYVWEVVKVCLPELFEDGKGGFANSNLALIDKIRSFIADTRVANAYVVGKRNEELNGCDGIASQLRVIVGSGQNAQKRASYVISLLEKMVESYSICVSLVPRSFEGKSSFRRQSFSVNPSLTFSYRLPLVVAHRRWVHNDGRNGVQGRVGLIRNNKTIYYGLGNADRTQSYHLQVVDRGDSFCSLCSLRRIEPQCPAKRRGLPTAEMAFIQRLREQRHVSLAIKNGEGFSHWFLMFRHEPRFSVPYAVVLVASFLVLTAVTMGLFGAERESNEELQLTMALSLVSALSAVVIAWVSKSGSRTRGDNFGPFAVAFFCFLASAQILLFCGGISFFLLDKRAIALSGGLLLAASLCVSARLTIWHFIVFVLRREKDGVADILCDEDCREDDCRGMIWSAGWVAIDGNRYIDQRDSVAS